MPTAVGSGFITTPLHDSLRKQLDLIRDDWISGRKQKGEYRFLIAAEWYSLWERYVNTPPEKRDASLHPGPIDNSSLVEIATGELKPFLTETQDFQDVPERSWDMLVQHYGVSEKWPSKICRKVIPTSIYSHLNKIEIYPLRLEVREHTNFSMNRFINCSRASTIDELIEMIRKLLVIPDFHDVKLWYGTRSSYFNTEVTFKPLTTDWSDDTLQKREIDDGSFIFVESCYPSQEPWPSSQPGFAEEAAKYGYSFQLFDSGKTVVLSNRGEIDSHTSNLSFDKPSVSGLCGLQNLGNTCFMNSAIQCLSNVPELTSFFRSGEYKDYVNRENKLGTKGELVDRYAALINALWSGNHSSVSPQAFKTTVGHFAPRFVGYSQQDSSELMSYVLEGLHEDLNKITVKPYYAIDDNDERTDVERGEEFWDCHKKRNDSKIVDLFHGQLKSTLKCNVCDNICLTFDPFVYLSVPLPKPTTQKVVAHFRFADPACPVAKMELNLSIDFSTKELQEALSTAVDVPANRIKVCGVTKTYLAWLQRWYDENGPASYSSKHDDAMGFELPPAIGDDEELVPVVYYLKSPDYYRIYPFLVLIPKSKLSSMEVFLRASKLLEPFWKTDQPKINDSESEGDVEMKKRRNYRLFHTNSSGSYEREEILPSAVDDTADFEKQATQGTQYVIINCVSCSSQLDFHRLMSTDDSRLKASQMGTSGEVHLDDCLRLFLTEEQLSEQNSWYCPRCKDHRRAFKKLDLWRLPPCLIVQLKRFDQEGGYSRAEKLDNFIRYPFEFDISGYLPETLRKKEIGDTSSMLYELIAVSNHFGNLSYGHYTAYALNVTTGKWHLFDDSVVNAVENLEDVVSSSGYLLVYKRREPGNKRIESPDNDS